MKEKLDLNILKTIIADKAKGVEFAYQFDQSLFLSENQFFAKLVLDYIKAYRNPPTLRTLLDRYGTDSDIQSQIKIFWSNLEEHEYNFQEYPYDLEKLKIRYEAFIIRRIRNGITDEKDAHQLLKEINLKIQQANVVRAGRSHIQKVVGEYIEEFHNRYSAIQTRPNEFPAIKTGYSLIDLVTGGLSPAELIMIGGETGAGKSMKLSNIATQMWLQGNTVNMAPCEITEGHSVLYFSLEMPYEDCFVRFMARLAGVPMRALTHATLDAAQYDRVKRVGEFIKDYEKAGYFFGIVDVPRNVTIEEIELRYSDALLKYKPEVVIIDYMGLMSYNSREEDHLKLGHLSESLHEFARAYGVIMLTAHQLTDIKRSSQSQSEEERKRVGPHRWGRSSMIMHNVNLGIQIETRPNEKNYPDLKYHIVKNRKGPVGGSASLLKDFARATLLDIPLANETDKVDTDPAVENALRSLRRDHD